MPNDPPVLGANPLVGPTAPQIAAALGRLLPHLAVQPGQAVAKTPRTPRATWSRWLVGRSDVGARARPTSVSPTRPGPANPVYRRLMQAYLVEARAALDLVDDVDLDAKSRVRARFALSLLTEAAAPTNTLLGNPQALARRPVETQRPQPGRPGFATWSDDLRHNGGMPATVDRRPFTVGGNLAVTPGQVVHRSEVFELIQYTPATGDDASPGRWSPSRRRSTSSTSPTSVPAAA